MITEGKCAGKQIRGELSLSFNNNVYKQKDKEKSTTVLKNGMDTKLISLYQKFCQWKN